MDSIIKRFDGVVDNDLVICPRGVAYQRNMKYRVAYGDDYLRKFAAYDEGISKAVNAGRCEFMLQHVPAGGRVLDIGAGDGAFVRAAGFAGFDAYGFDIIPSAAKALSDAKVYAEDPSDFDAVTLWDVIEHMDMPETRLKAIRKHAHVFVSLPIFDDLTRIRESKHYRPGEHLYYWTEQGFINYMAGRGFRLVGKSAHETQAGRESIGAFAFCRDLPDYHDHIALYKQMHSERYYGGSATELHLEDVAKVVRQIGPKSIIDFGCGRSDIASYFYLDGKRKIAKYDPAIPMFSPMPEGRFDLALCLDLMEHIPISSVDRILAEIREKASSVFFTISTKPARAKLPDGRNAHVTLLTKSEWTRWIADVFKSAKELPSKWDHELILLTGQ